MLFNALLISLGLALGPSSVAASIWPVPTSIETGDKVVFIDQTVCITYNGDNLTQPDAYTGNAGAQYDSRKVVEGAVSRVLSSIWSQNIVPWQFHEHMSDFEPEVSGDKTLVKSLQITQTETNDEKSPYQELAGDADESYNLTLSSDGEAEITAATSIGVLRGLETFGQLFYSHSSGKEWYTTLAPVSIEDSPKYPHRGILMDTARHFFPLKDILKTIDAMSWTKLNKLHLHLTDSQSWPLVVPSLPELAEKGAYAKGLWYSVEDMQHIHEYAINRGVQVIVEIDMPGHTGSIALAYPELIVAYNEQPYHWWCVQPPCGAFKMNSTKVDEFLDTLMDDVLPRVAPYTAYWHMGGDELNRNDSMLDEGVRSNDTAVLQPLVQRFVDKAHDRIRKHGLTPFVWEEMALEWNVTLGKDVVVQSWLGGEAVKELTSKGHKVIDSNYNFFYLDCGRGAWLNFDNGAAFEQYYPFNDWCTPTKGWRLIYSHDPREGLTDEEAELVLGGEVTGWSESIDAVNLDNVLWPRSAAAGEVLWSGRTDVHGTNRSQYEVAPRLAEFRERMVARGVGAAPVYQLFCSMVSPEECAYQM